MKVVPSKAKMCSDGDAPERVTQSHHVLPHAVVVAVLVCGRGEVRTDTDEVRHDEVCSEAGSRMAGVMPECKSGPGRCEHSQQLRTR